jgi:nitrogen fixation protein FixH
MTYLPENQASRIGFPTHVSKGEILFSRPNDKNLDFAIPINKISLFNYCTEELKKGFWKVQAIWSDGLSEYYLEGKFTV